MRRTDDLLIDDFVCERGGNRVVVDDVVLNICISVCEREVDGLSLGLVK